jgi:acyl carrier protein
MAEMRIQPGAFTQEEVERKVVDAVAKSLDLDPDDIKLSSSLQEELGAESLDYLDIAFMLEREFKVQFPRADLLQRAGEFFGEDTLVKDGIVTDMGVEMLRRGMPEINPERFHKGIRAADVAKIFTVATFVRVVMRLLDAKQLAPKTCLECGAPTVESDVRPEFVCSGCGKVFLPPSSDDILFQDLIDISKGKEIADLRARTEND